MEKKPHKESLLAAIENPKAKDDVSILKEIYASYQDWIKKLKGLTSKGRSRINEMTALLNEYKDYVEVELILRKGSSFLKQQKGHLKLDSSIMEEFLIHLVHPDILNNLPDFEVDTGPQKAFISLAFLLSGLPPLEDKPEIMLEPKDQDFTTDESMSNENMNGEFVLAVLAAECKVNYDKTMFQKCLGTASRLKQSCLISKYYVLIEYLDMEPEDVRLTEINNILVLRKAKRLPFNKRDNYMEVKAQHKDSPIANDVIAKFVDEIQNFIDVTCFNPDEVLKRGSFL